MNFDFSIVGAILGDHSGGLLIVSVLAVLLAAVAYDRLSGRHLVFDMLRRVRLSSRSLEAWDRTWSERKKSEAIVCLTTTPSRLPHLKPTLKSLLDQEVAPGKIRIHLPHFSAREQCAYELPSWLGGLICVDVVRCEDHGPATKLIPVLCATNPDQAIIVVDDDMLYPPTMIADLLSWAEKNPDTAVGSSGWEVPQDLTDRPTSLRMHLLKHPPAPILGTTIRRPHKVDILQGYSGYLVKPRFFDFKSVADYSRAPQSAFFVDDVWFSAHCKADKVVFPARRFCIDRLWRYRFFKRNSLGRINRGGGDALKRNNTIVIRHFADRWMKFKVRPPELTFVTAADSAYGRCVVQLLLSARRQRLHRKYRWVLYDLGLDAPRRREIENLFPWVSIHEFDFAAYPAHFAISHQSYGWKVALIRERVKAEQGPILFLDSATILCGPPDEVIAELRSTGLYALRGQSALGQHCDPLTLGRLQVALELFDQNEFVTGVIGLDGAREDIRELVDRWYELAADSSIISPRTPKLPQHKPEQALLSFLLLERQARGLSVPTHREIDISSTQPIRWMSSRNKVANRVPVWADPIVRAWFWLYKTADRCWLHIKSFDARHVGGWQRWLNEHYSVYIGRRGETSSTLIRSPSHSYYADPFVFEFQGHKYLLVEEFQYKHNRGRLLTMKLSERLQPDVPTEIPLGTGHVSFPFVFESNGKAYLIPETSERLCIDLYSLENFPEGLRRVRRLVYGVDAADTVMFKHQEYYWLITSVRDEPSQNRYLSLYSTDDWLCGDWIPHPVNAERRYAERKWSYGRCAGPPILSGKGVIRPIHASKNYYGERLEWRLITQLDREKFVEETVMEPPELRHIVNGQPLHHVSTSTSLWACDTRDVKKFSDRLRTILFPGSLNLEAIREQETKGACRDSRAT